MKIGDKVRIPSTGPVMTVIDLQQHEAGQFAVCVWFDGEHHEHRATYRVEVLETKPEQPNETSPRFPRTVNTWDD